MFYKYSHINTRYYINQSLLLHCFWRLRNIFRLRSRTPPAIFSIVFKKKNIRKHKRNVCYFDSKETLFSFAHYGSKSLWRSLRTKYTAKCNWWKWCPHDSLLLPNWKVVMSRPFPILYNHFVCLSFFFSCKGCRTMKKLSVTQFLVLLKQL